MPENFSNSTCRSIFAEKMEYNISDISYRRRVTFQKRWGECGPWCGKLLWHYYWHDSAAKNLSERRQAEVL